MNKKLVKTPPKIQNNFYTISSLNSVSKFSFKIRDFGFKIENFEKKNSKVKPFLNGYSLKTGINIGHKSLRLSKINFWHPLMAHYFLGIRHGITLLNPVQTRKCLLRAFYIIALVLKSNDSIIYDNYKHKVSNSNSLNLKKKKQINSVSNSLNLGSNLKNLNPNSNILNNYEVLSFSKSKLNSGNILGNNKENSLLHKEKNKSDSLQKVIQRKGHILIVNTNPEFSQFCKNLGVLTLHSQEIETLSRNSQSFLLDNIYTENKSLSFIHYKWVGGTLTNWKQVSKSVLTYAKFAERCEKFLLKNNIDFPRYNKIKECFHGLITKRKGKIFLAFNDKPDLVFLMNPNENRHIIAEANKMHIPVIALVESNTCLNGISYPIPANAYSTFFIYYCLKKILKLSTI